jgi:radical SAM superfamily enzyme YgiQ (UPF0313 family)
MRVLLIVPTALDGFGKPVRMRRLHVPCLTLAQLAAVTPREVLLKLVYETVEDIPYDEPWDLVGLNSMGSGIVRAWAIADEFRRRGVKTVIGGVPASLSPPDWTLAHADSVVIGEAEETWPRLLADAAGGALEPVYRMENRPAIGSLPLPRYDLFDGDRFGAWRPVQATRGCPFTCNFCSVTAFFGQSYRKRPVEHVVRDVREAKRTGGIRHITFIDDNIGVDLDYCARLWEALIPEKIIWMSQCSLHIARHPELLELAHRSGCRMLSFGFETTNPESLSSVNKSWNRPDTYTDAIDTIRGHGIDVSTEMVVGLDGDDESVFQRTYDFIMDHGISIPRIHIITPVPGTPLYDSLEAEGRIIGRNLDEYSGSSVVYRPRNIDPDVLHAGYWRLYEEVFRPRNILKRIGRNRASQDLHMRAIQLAVNLKYRSHIRNRITPGIV